MERKSRKILQFISFVAIFVIGLVLLVDAIFGSKTSFMLALKNIANALAYFVVIANGFFYIRTKRSNVFTLIYIIGVLLLAICFIVPFIK